MNMRETQSAESRLRETLQRKVTSLLEQKWWRGGGVARGSERNRDRETFLQQREKADQPVLKYGLFLEPNSNKSC